MKPIVRKLLVSLLFVTATSPLLAAGAAGTSRYLVVLKSGPAGVSNVTDAQIATLGGTVEFRLPARLEMTLSDRAAEVLRGYPAVKYVQRVATSETPSAEPTSILRLHPKTMVVNPPSWTSGTFKYDGSGNIYAIGLAGESGVTPHTYTYDNLSRLTRATNVVGQTEAFFYDEYGNMTRHDAGMTATTIALDASNNNRLQTTTTVQYDAVGNLISDEAAVYRYDPFSQLLEKDFSAPTGTTDKELYLYTAGDERIGVKQNDTWTWSIRDFGGKVLRQYQSSATQPTSSWLWMEDYIYRDGLLFGADRPAEEGGRRYMHLDHLGTPRLVTGANGVKIAEHELAPFGIEPTPLWEDSTTHGFDREDPMRFTGHERDFAQLSRMVTTPYLDYMHARYYSPGVGRFLSPDPLLGDESKPQSWNRYTYAENNPITNIDPFGLAPCDIVGSDGKKHPGECIEKVAPHPDRADRAAKRNSALRDAQLRSALQKANSDLRQGFNGYTGYTPAMRAFTGYNVWQHFGSYIYHHPEDIGTELAGAFFITDLRYVKGGVRMLRGNVTEGGGVEAARSQFERLTGRSPNGSVDQVTLPDGTTIRFRESGSGGAKVEVNDPGNHTYQKTTFRDTP